MLAGPLPMTATFKPDSGFIRGGATPADVLQRFADRAGQLALGFLRTDPPADSGEQAVAFNDVNCFLIIIPGDGVRKSGYINADRAAFNAWGVFALQAAQRLEFCLFRRIAQRNLGYIFAPFGGILAGHFLGRNLQAVFWLERLSV